MATDQEIIMAQAKELSDLRAATERAAKSAAIAGALTGYQLSSPYAADQFAKIVDDQVAVHRDANGAFSVTGPGFQPIGEFVKARLASDFSHFVQSGSSTSPAARQAGPTGQGEVKTLSDAVIHQMRLNGTHGTDHDGRTDPSKAFGLREVSRR